MCTDNTVTSFSMTSLKRSPARWVRGGSGLILEHLGRPNLKCKSGSSALGGVLLDWNPWCYLQWHVKKLGLDDLTVEGKGAFGSLGMPPVLFCGSWEHLTDIRSWRPGSGNRVPFLYCLRALWSHWLDWPHLLLMWWWTVELWFWVLPLYTLCLTLPRF